MLQKLSIKLVFGLRNNTIIHIQDHAFVSFFLLITHRRFMYCIAQSLMMNNYLQVTTIHRNQFFSRIRIRKDNNGSGSCRPNSEGSSGSGILGHLYCLVLQFLELSNNRLTGLPAQVGELAHLREICLSLNQLTTIPPCLATCSKLETILIANNQVRAQSNELVQHFRPYTVTSPEALFRQHDRMTQY
jgi:Leucine-rich repeat (LRR) protein